MFFLSIRYQYYAASADPTQLECRYAKLNLHVLDSKKMEAASEFASLDFEKDGLQVRPPGVCK